MKEQLIELETARLAKEKGFDWECLLCYTGTTQEIWRNDYSPKNWNKNTHHISAPTQSLLQKWLREEKGIFVYCTPYTFDYSVWYIFIDEKQLKFKDVTFYTYEQALEKGLQIALKEV